MTHIQTSDFLDPLLGSGHKGYPRTQAARPRSTVGDAGWNLLAGDLPLPLAVLRREALAHNLAWMQARVDAWGVSFAPHGKTTMSPQLFRRQLEAGAWGLTFATIFLHDIGHAGLGLISATMAAIQIGAAVMRVWSGRWTDRHGNRRRYLRACSALSVVLYIALGTAAALAPAVWPQWVLAAIALLLVMGGVCASAWHGVAYTELATLAGPRQVGTALGLGNTCVFLVFFLAAQAVPALLAWQSWSAVWLAGAVGALIAWPIFLKPLHRNRPG